MGQDKLSGMLATLKENGVRRYKESADGTLDIEFEAKGLDMNALQELVDSDSRGRSSGVESNMSPAEELKWKQGRARLPETLDLGADN